MAPNLRVRKEVTDPIIRPHSICMPNDSIMIMVIASACPTGMLAASSGDIIRYIMGVAKTVNAAPPASSPKIRPLEGREMSSLSPRCSITPDTTPMMVATKMCSRNPATSLCPPSSPASTWVNISCDNSSKEL